MYCKRVFVYKKCRKKLRVGFFLGYRKIINIKVYWADEKSKCKSVWYDSTLFYVIIINNFDRISLR